MAARKKVSDEAVIAAYDAHGSVWSAGRALGVCGQSVHDRLVKLGKNVPKNLWTEKDNDRLRREYLIHRDAGKLDTLAGKMGRTKQFICRQAKTLGLTDQRHPRVYAQFWKSMSEDVARALMDKWRRSGKPMGAFCKKHGYGIGFWQTLSRMFPAEYESIVETNRPQGKYTRGRSHEYAARDALRAAGYVVLRAAASRGPADLVAIAHGSVLFVQCKIGSWHNVPEWNAFYDLCVSVSATPVFCDRGPGGARFWVLTGKKTGAHGGAKQGQPMIAFDLRTARRALTGNEE